MSKVRVYRFYLNSEMDDYLDYEAAGYKAAYEKFRKDTHRVWCYSCHILKGRELTEWRRQNGG